MSNRLKKYQNVIYIGKGFRFLTSDFKMDGGIFLSNGDTSIGKPFYNRVVSIHMYRYAKDAYWLNLVSIFRVTYWAC